MHLRLRKCEKSPQTYRKLADLRLRNTSCSFAEFAVAELSLNLRCPALLKCDKKFFVESHQKSKQQQRKLETKSKSKGKQTFLQLDQVNFKKQVVSSFLAADIPLHKLNHPSLKSLFATMGKVLSSETTARACVAKLASQKEQIQELLRDKNIFLIVDEAEIAKQNYISVLVGSLDAPNQTLLVDCHPLDSGSNVNQLRTDFFLTRGSPVAGIIFDKKTLYIYGGFC